MNDESVSAVHFATSLSPYRSLSPEGFKWLIRGAIAANLLVGLPMYLLGAWPVMGFMGLDVFLLYGAFRLSYRSGRMRETLRLEGDDLTVERVSVRGEVRTWRFQAFWLRLLLVEQGAERNRLLLRSHGRELAIGGFLTADERRSLAAELDDALMRYRNPSTSFMP